MYTQRMPPAQTELLQTGLEALDQHGIPATVTKPPLADQAGVVRLKLGRRGVRWPLLLERWLTPATVGHVIRRRPRTDQPALLVTDYVTPHLAEQLRALGINFVDAAGNAYLQEGPVLIWVVGRKAGPAMRPPRAGRAFQPSGLRVVFALLCIPDLAGRPTRTIAVQAGVANGTVGIVLRELREDGYLVDLRQRPGKRTLRNRKRLLEQWTQAYARTLRPRLLVARYRPPEPEWWRTVNPHDDGAVFGGEAAEVLLTGTLVRPEVVTMYLPKAPDQFIFKNRLVKAPEGPVEIREKFWPFEHAWDHPNLAPPILIYADLLAMGDARCLEAAHRLYEEQLARLVAAE